MSQDEVRQAQQDELLRARMMVSELLDRMDQRLVQLGYQESDSDRQRMEALDRAAELIADRPSEAWDGWITYLLKALDQKTTTEEFHRVLEVLQADVAARLVEGQW